jgi:hypothetical protein
MLDDGEPQEPTPARTQEGTAAKQDSHAENATV